MQILSVNVGQEQTQPKGDGLEITGIYKIPVDGPVRIRELGISEDFICDQENHGGPDQAIYIYGAPDYEWWSRELGQELAPGTFGENLTLSEFESAHYSIGDRLKAGSVVLEFTAPRIPCSTLARRMRDPQFIKKYRLAERPGMYCRVIQEGTLRAGDPAVLIPYQGTTVSALDVFREHVARHKNIELLRRILQTPVAIRERREVEEDLRRLGGS
jgi:MOSC domain-containing protein YiiM